MSQTVIVLESPYSGDNVAYTQRAMKHAREKGEIVIIPHLLWTQHHNFVSDWDEKYTVKNGGRDVSLEQIKELRRRADKVVFYTDYGMSSGMKHGLEHCKAEHIPYEERTIGDTDIDSKTVYIRNNDKIALKDFLDEHR